MSAAPVNTFFPGRDSYTGPTTGWFAFLHHEKLFEESHDMMERVAYVKSKKPKREVWIRLHNMMYLDPGLYPAVAKCAPLDAEILAYIKLEIPDCAWNGKTLIFDMEPK